MKKFKEALADPGEWGFMGLRTPPPLNRTKYNETEKKKERKKQRNSDIKHVDLINHVGPCSRPV